MVCPGFEGETKKIVGKTLTGPGESQGLLLFERITVRLESWLERCMQLAATPDLAVSATSLPKAQRTMHLLKFVSQLGSDWNMRHS